MHRAVSCALAFAAATTFASAQDRPAPEPLLDDEHIVVIKGCVDRNRLKHAASVSRDVPAEIIRVSEWILEGPQELLQQIRREHDGHFDEITGRVIVPRTTSRKTQVQSKTAGKTTITLGVGEDSSPVPEAPRPVRIKVESLKHVSEKCVRR